METWKRVALSVLPAALAVAGVARTAEPARPVLKLLYVGRQANREYPVLFSMNRDGTGMTALGSGDAPELDPALSPDGKQVAFSRVNPADDSSDLYVMSADGTGRRKLTSLKGHVFGPAWSPDGKRLAFTRTEDKPGAPPAPEIYVTGVPDGRPERLGPGLLPQWSRDGKRLVYSVFTGVAHETQLQVMDADGTHSRVLLKGPALMGTWSPDGKRLAYLVPGAKGLPRLYVGEADGSHAELVDRNGGDIEVGPVWAPDSRSLFFTRMLPDGQVASIFESALDGKPARQVTPAGVLAWLGNGGWFLLVRGEAASDK